MHVHGSWKEFLYVSLGARVLSSSSAPRWKMRKRKSGASNSTRERVFMSPFWKAHVPHSVMLPWPEYMDMCNHKWAWGMDSCSCVPGRRENRLVRLDTHLALWIHLMTCLLLDPCSSYLDLFLPQFPESTTESWHFYLSSLNFIQMFVCQGCLLSTLMVPHITIYNTHFIAFILFDKCLSP